MTSIAANVAFCLCALLALSAQSQAELKEIEVEPCKEGSISNIKNVRVTNCDTLPCDVSLSIPPRFEVTFVAARDSNTMKISLEGELPNLSKPLALPGFRTDACAFMSVVCPLKAGEAYTAKAELKLLKVFPLISAKARFTGSDAGGEVFCFKIPVKLSK